MYKITFSINMEVCGLLIYEFCCFRFFEISIYCGLREKFVDCVKYNMCMIVCLLSVECHI